MGSSSVGQDYDTVFKNLSKLIQNVARNNRLLESTLKNPSKLDNNPEEANKVAQLMHQNNELLITAKDDAKTLQRLLPSDPSNHKKANLSKERLNKELKEICETFLGLQKQGQKLLNESLQNARRRASSDMSSNRGDSSSTEFGGSRHQQQQMMYTTEAQMTSQEIDLQIVQEREEQLRGLEADMTELLGIHNDIKTMVYEQGETVDDIEANTDKAVNDVTAANKNFVQAVSHQSSARKKKFFVFALAGVAVGLIVILIVLVLKVFT